jgi:hypothetical protein
MCVCVCVCVVCVCVCVCVCVISNTRIKEVFKNSDIYLGLHGGREAEASQDAAGTRRCRVRVTAEECT